MQENKYYTPSIEDFKVGYEYEQYHPSFYNNGGKVENRSIWNKNIIKEPLMYGDTLSRNIEKMFIRTQYLTDQQIIKEGWEPKEIYGDSVCIYQKGTKEEGFELVYNFQKHTLTFRKLYFFGLDEKYSNKELHLYCLECKSVNELRTLEKFFKIN